MERSKGLLRLGMALTLAVVGVAVVFVSMDMGNPLSQPIGPGYVPSLLGGALVILCLVEVTQAAREIHRARAAARSASTATVGPAVGSTEARWLLTALLLGLAIYLWGIAGGLVGLLAAIFAVILVDRRSSLKKGLAVAVGIALFIWLLFEQLLKVSLG